MILSTVMALVGVVLITAAYGWLIRKHKLEKENSLAEMPNALNPIVDQAAAFTAHMQQQTEQLNVALREANTRAKKLENYYERLNEMVATGVMRYNKNLALRACNRAATLLCAPTSDFLVNAVTNDGVRLLELIETIDAVVTTRVHLKHTDKTLDVLIYPVYSITSMRIQQYLLYINDVTEQVKLSDKLKNLNEELERTVSLRTTELRIAQEDLRQSRDMYKQLYEHTPIGMYVTRVSDGVFLDANIYMARALGYATIEELKTHTSIEHFINKADRTTTVDALAKKYGEAPYVYNLPIRTASGEPRLFQFHEVALEPQGLYEGAIIDITAQAAAARRVTALQMLYQSTLDLIGDGVIAFDCSEALPSVAYKNAAADRLLGHLGYTPPQVGETCRSCGGDLCSPVLCSLIKRVMVNGGYDVDTLTSLDKTSTYALLAKSMHATTSYAPPVKYVVCIIQDRSITKYNNTANQELELMQQAIDELTQAAIQNTKGTDAADQLLSTFAKIQNLQAAASIRNMELETILGAVSDAVYIVDPAHHIAMLYPSLTINDTPGQTLANTYGASVEATVLSTAHMVLSSGKVQKMRVTVDTRVYDVRVLPLNRNATQAIALFKDVTDVVTYERLLRILEGLIETMCKKHSMRIDALEEILGQLGQLMDVDRVYVMKNAADKANTPVTYTQIAEWCAPGILSQKDNAHLKQTPYTKTDVQDTLYDFWTTLSSGDVFSIDTQCSVGDYVDRVREQGIVTLLVVPVMTHQEFTGFVGFDLCRTEREWRTIDIAALRVLAAIIGNTVWWAYVTA